MKITSNPGLSFSQKEKREKTKSPETLLIIKKIIHSTSQKGSSLLLSAHSQISKKTRLKKMKRRKEGIGIKYSKIVNNRQSISFIS